MSDAQNDDLLQYMQLDASNPQLSSESDIPALLAPSPSPSLSFDATIMQRYASTATPTPSLDGALANESAHMTVPLNEAEQVPYYPVHSDSEPTAQVHSNAIASDIQPAHASSRSSREHDHLYDDGTVTYTSTSRSADTSMVSVPVPSGIEWQLTLGAIQGHDKLDWVHIALPSSRDLSPGQVLVSMYAVSLCAADVKLRRRQHQQPQATGSTKSVPRGTGFCGSGVVVAVGSTQHSSSSASASMSTAIPFRPGDRVYGRMKYALAQYAVADVSAIVKCHPHQPMCEAAACGVVAEGKEHSTPTIAFNHQSLDTTLRNKTIYLNTGGGTVGHLLLQALKAMNNRVISAYSRFDTFMLLHELRCDVSINYAEQDVVYEIMRYTNGKGCDVVIDLLGTQQTLEQAALCVADNGTLYATHIGPDTPLSHQQHRHGYGHGMQSRVRRKHVTVHHISLCGTQFGFTISPAMLTSHHTSNNEAVVKPRIHRRCHFSRHGINQALTEIESHKSIGSIIVKIR